MAKIQFGVVVTDARGKLGGSQFSLNRSGAILQRKCQQRKGATQAQSSVRSGFSYLARFWRTLSVSDKNSNSDAAVNYPYVDKFGNTRYFNGYQLLLRSNLNRRYSGLGPISVVPATPPAGFELTGIELYAEQIGGTGSELLVTWLGVSPNPEEYSVQVFNSPMVSDGVNLYSGRYVFLKADLATTGEVAVSPIVNGTQFNWAVGGKIFARVVVIHMASGVEVSSYVITAIIV